MFQETEEDENVTLLMSMGFPDKAEVKKALKLAKNDMNEAVALLTSESPGLYEADVDMSEPSTSGSTDETDASSKDSIEFPTTHLYELESRVFTSNWSIPYRKDGRLLIASTKLAKQGLTDSEDMMKRFMESCLPTCFEKLLNSYMVNKWAADVQDGIFAMLKLFIELVCARLPTEPVPHKILEVLALAFDPQSEYNQKNRSKHWERLRWESEFGGPDRTFAVPSQQTQFSSSQSYGYLVNLINMFASKGGVTQIQEIFAQRDLNCEEMYSLLNPLAVCADYLNPDVVAPMLAPCVEKAKLYVTNLNDIQLKKPSIQYAMTLICSTKLLTLALWPDNAEEYDTLRLDMILRMLKSSHFVSRMQALKEITKLLDTVSSSKVTKLMISAGILSDWLTKNQVLSLALEGNIDQAQYCDRLKTLLEFLGPRLTCTDIAKMWQLQKNKTAVTVDNLHTMLGQAAVKFQENELNYLMALFEKSWATESARGREKLLYLVGRIGKETVISKTFNKALEVLWRLSHLPNLSVGLLDIALEEHLGILNQTGRETERNQYVMACVEDVKKKQWILPAIYHIDCVIRNMTKSSSYSSYKSNTRENYLKTFLDQSQFIKLLCECLVEKHKEAIHSVKLKNLGPEVVSPAASPVSPFKEPASFTTALQQPIVSSLLAVPTVMAATTVPNWRKSVTVTIPDAMTPNETVELNEEFLMSDGYTYGLFLKTILDFLRFCSTESSVLSWVRVKEIWETLIEDPQACEYEKESALDWFEKCLSNLDQSVRQSLFDEKILKVDPGTLSTTGFRCFRSFFEDLNMNARNLKKSINGKLNVENANLIGLDYVWQIIVNCLHQDIVDDAIQMLMDFLFRNLSEKLKKDPENHKRFLKECYRRLEAAGAVLNVDSSALYRLLLEATRTIAAPTVPALAQLPPPSRSLRVQNIERLLYLARTYIRVVDEQSDGVRMTPSHSASFFSRTFYVNMLVDLPQNHPKARITFIKLMVHEGEQLNSIRDRVADRLQIDPRSVVIEKDGDEVKKSSDQMTMKLLAIDNNSTLTVKTRPPTTSFVASLDSAAANSDMPVLGGAGKSNYTAIEKERSLPAMIMANDTEVFQMFHLLVKLGEPRVTRRVRELICLIPSDRTIGDALDALDGSGSSSGSTSKSNSLERLKKATVGQKGSSTSPKLRIRHSNSGNMTSSTGSLTVGGSVFYPSGDEKKPGSSVVKSLFELSPTGGLTPFQLLYNLEVLSGKLLPTAFDASSLLAAQTFCKSFLSSGGLGVLLGVVGKDSLSTLSDHHLRSTIYERALTILSYLLVNVSPLHQIVESERYEQQKIAIREGNAESECAATGSATSAASVESSASAGITGGSLSSINESLLPQSCAVRGLSDPDFSLLLECLQRLSWAAAGGQLHMVGADLLSPQSATTFVLGGRNRTSESSTASTGSSDNEAPTSLHSAVWNSHSNITDGDVNVARRAIQLIVDCCRARPADVHLFFKLAYLSDYVIDSLLVSESKIIRHCMYDALVTIADLESTVNPSCPDLATSRIRGETPNSDVPTNLRKRVLRAQVGGITGGGDMGRPSPRLQILQMLLKTPLPLWTNSCNVRGSSQRLMSHCCEYFLLRGTLVETLSESERQSLTPSTSQMLQDEVNWLLNYTCTSEKSEVDNAVIAAHLGFMQKLVGISSQIKKKVGDQLITPLLEQFLFPAARVICETKRDQMAIERNLTPKCAQVESRIAAFEMLVELADCCPDNFRSICAILIGLHHQPSSELSQVWDFTPLVDGRISAGFVGLKNAGATCYMNSVLQQFFMEPNIPPAILGADVELTEESLFYQLQSLFAHLQQSHLEYFTPKQFWDSFRLWGKPVNPREQQDAFEFFTELIDQMDQCLKTHDKEEVFKKRYQGVFSDQKICKGCPHRYEREEAFYALNLPVRVQNLEESLNQFAKGEILEGENAYLCELCNEKRTTLKRLCVKTLPPTMVIHLKRFNYDFEENRSLKFNDYFQFPLMLDMYPYTASGLSKLENDEDFFSSSLPSSSLLAESAPLLISPYSAASLATSPLAGSPLTSSPMGRKLSSTERLKRTPVAIRGGMESRYELVGVVVHSGQANAGHYYSFIKDRREDLTTNKTFGKWFRFNDTTVEEVDVTPTFMETEWFGGRYQAKVEKNSGFPEERERYWNAYILFYQRCESRDSLRMGRRTPSKRSMSFGPQLQPPGRVVTPAVTQPSRRDSLMELAELVEAGERQRLFGETIPPRIRQQISDENLRFARDKDIYNKEYAIFVRNLIRTVAEVDQSDDCLAESAETAVAFGTQYLLNTVLHTKRSLRNDLVEWNTMLNSLAHRSEKACLWLTNFLATPPGNACVADYLLICPVAEVRTAVGNIFHHVISAHVCVHKMAVTSPDFDQMIVFLLELLVKQAIDHWQNTFVLFQILHYYSGLSADTCSHLLSKQAFRALLNFMLQNSTPAESDSKPCKSGSFDQPTVLTKRWTPSQARDFGIVYNTLAGLILSCDVRPFRTADTQDDETEAQINIEYLPMPKEMEMVLFGCMSTEFVKELVWACCNVEGTVDTLVSVVLYCSLGNHKFTNLVVREALVCCAQNLSNELKSVFMLLDKLIGLSDSLSEHRLNTLLDGVQDAKVSVDGILAVIRASHSTDSRRSYNCVKFLVAASNTNSRLKESLNLRQDHWQWAVDWLKKTMEDHTGFSPGGSSMPNGTFGPMSAPSTQSNEDSNTKTFQRTASAQYTLDQARALLSEFETVSMEIGEEDSRDSLASLSDGQPISFQPNLGPSTSDDKRAARPNPLHSPSVIDNGPTKKSRSDESPNLQGKSNDANEENVPVSTDANRKINLVTPVKRLEEEADENGLNRRL